MESVAEYVKYHTIITICKIKQKDRKTFRPLAKMFNQTSHYDADSFSLPSFLSHFIEKLFIVLIKNDVILAYHLSIKMYTVLPLVI